MKIKELNINKSKQNFNAELLNDRIHRKEISYGTNSEIEMMSETGNEIFDQQLHDHRENAQTSKVRILSKLIFFSITLIVVAMVTILYFVMQSIPTKDNVFEITDQYLIYFVTYSMSLVLILSNSYLIPGFINAFLLLFNLSFSHRTAIIMVIRTVNTIIFPLISSIILLPQCMNGWTAFWKLCKTDNSLNIYNEVLPRLYISDILYLYPPLTVQSMKHSNICQLRTFNNKNFRMEKCIRQYFFEWSNVMVNKLILYIFLPFVSLFGKILKKWFYSKVLKKNKRISVDVDSQFSMVTTLLEILVIYSIIVPSIAALTLFILLSNMIYYNIVNRRLEYKIVFGYNQNGLS
eukprot:160765_1